MKQTAVEWLLENLNSEPYSEEEFNYNRDCWDKALEMEKEQIVEAHGNKLKKSKDEGNYEYWFSGEDYYNKTFKNTKQ
jgi:hypothetical protein